MGLGMKREMLLKEFCSIANIPYGAVGSRAACKSKTLTKASCSTKHVILATHLEKIGFKVKRMMGIWNLAEFGRQLYEPIHVPTGTIDYHNYLEVNLNNRWLVLDATFGRNEESRGFFSNISWSADGDCLHVFPVYKSWIVDDIFDAKARAIANLTSSQKHHRDSFFSDLLNQLQ